MGVEGAPPTAGEIQEVRQELARRLSEADIGEVEQVDLQRLNTDDKYLTKFWRHVFDHPGTQTEAAVKMILNTLKFRKEMGASTIREEDFPPGLLDRGALFSHNRFEAGSMYSSVLSCVRSGTKMDGNSWCSVCSNT